MKIAVMHASAGAGHTKAAEAVSSALKNSNAQCEVCLVDSLDYTNSFFKWIYPKAYLFLIDKLPLVWGGLYYFCDIPIFSLIVNIMRWVFNTPNTFNLKRFIRDAHFDVIVSTHFLPSEIVAQMKREGKYKGKLITVVTDFGSHDFWINKGTDLYVVAHEDTRLDIISRKIEKSAIRVLGIPIGKEFAQPLDRPGIAARLGIDARLFTVLIVSGGFGVGPILELTAQLGNADVSIQLIVVCGKNEKLHGDVLNISSKLKRPCKVYGFSRNMHELMSVSDVIITKSGGITVSEALSFSLPMIIISPILGQETKNCNLLVKHQAAIRVDKAPEAKQEVCELFNDKLRLEGMKRNCKTIARPNSAMDIANLALESAKPPCKGIA